MCLKLIVRKGELNFVTSLLLKLESFKNGQTLATDSTTQAMNWYLSDFVSQNGPLLNLSRANPASARTALSLPTLSFAVWYSLTSSPHTQL